jgi:N-carbamoylputrescine amidase
MRVTVCQMNDNPVLFESDWEGLVEHARQSQSDLILLPELPFYPWFGVSSNFDESIWMKAVAAHDRWLERCRELSSAGVIATRPVNSGGRRLNEGFIWEPAGGSRAVHHKFYLPNEAGFWEASWYEPGADDFTTADCGAAKIGFEICTEIWAVDRARVYGKQGVHLIVTPRATPQATVRKWLAVGQVTAIVSGAYSLSSNHCGEGENGIAFGGSGWIIAPDGEVLATTSDTEPFVTVEIDLDRAAEAKQTYPRYLL